MSPASSGGLGLGLTSKQVESIKQSHATLNLWEGAVASGKTIGSLVRWMAFLATTRSLPGELVMTGRTRDTVWRNCILPLQDFMPDLVSGNLGAPTVKLAGRTVHVIGAADVKAEQVIRGMTILGAYVDEVTTLQQDYFRMLMTRLRVRAPGAEDRLASKLFATTNPDGPKHWLKVDYLDNPSRAKDWTRFRFTIDDNPTLPAEYVRLMHAQYEGLWYRRFILGEWVAAEGAIWGSVFDEDRHVVDASLVPQPDRILCVGIDYGTEHPTAGIALGLSQGRLWALREWAPPTGLAPSQYSAHLRDEFLPGLRRDFGSDPEWLRVDPAARDFREQLFYDGHNNIATARNAVVPGIRTVSSVFALDRLLISDECSHLLGEIPSYTWDPRATARGEEAPVKEKDDFCDALRYAVYSTASEWQSYLPALHGIDSEAEAE